MRRQFPDWTVHSEVLRGTPADALLGKVDEWKPDLIVGGAQGRSAIARFFLGSVSKAVAEKASCSVRVVRRGVKKTDDAHMEIILGAKNPAEAERIVAAVGRRVWPEDTRIRLIAVDETVAAGGVAAYCPDGKSMYETAADSLATVCLKVSLQIESGDPKTIFLEAADAWQADAIFVSAGRANDSGLDETSSSLITNAKCTVEVVR
jgi:nucleotide-binding universal stress UspA family protein